MSTEEIKATALCVSTNVHCATSTLLEVCSHLEKSPIFSDESFELWKIIRELNSFSARFVFHYDPDTYFGK